MGGAKGIVVALGALGETAQAAAGAQRANAVSAAGQDLVRIGLMADVPDQAVAGSVEDVMDRCRQFDDAETGAEMAARNRDGVDGFLAKLVGDLPELVHFETAQIVWRFDGVEKRRFTKFGHGDFQFFKSEPQVQCEVQREMGCTNRRSKARHCRCCQYGPQPDFQALDTLRIG